MDMIANDHAAVPRNRHCQKVESGAKGRRTPDALETARTRNTASVRDLCGVPAGSWCGPIQPSGSGGGGTHTTKWGSASSFLTTKRLPSVAPTPPLSTGVPHTAPEQTPPPPASGGGSAPHSSESYLGSPAAKANHPQNSTVPTGVPPPNLPVPTSGAECEFSLSKG